MTDGLPMLARLSAAPTLLVGLAARPCIRLKSWDRAVLPLPFARGAIVWAGPIASPAPGDDLAAVGADWAARLVNVDAPGSTSANLPYLGHTRCERPIFPLDEGVTFTPEVTFFQRARYH